MDWQFRGLAAVGAGDNRAFDGASERVVVYILVRNVGKRDRDEWVAKVNQTSAGIGWTGADRMAVFGLRFCGSGLGRLVFVKVVG